MNYHHTSDGNRISKDEIDRNIRKAKAEKIRLHVEEFSYICCTTCGRNDCKPVDCAHIISVNECQKSGHAELAWDLDNIVLEGRECHKKRDGLDLKFNSNT